MKSSLFLSQITEKPQDLERDLKECIPTYKDFPTPGINFKDIQGLMMNPSITRKTLDLSLRCVESRFSPDSILGFDARGFAFGPTMAILLSLPFIMARKKGKLPGELVVANYQKEYGVDTISIQKGLIKPGMKILVHDDLLATGGTARAAVDLIEKEGGIVSGFHFIMELEYLAGRKKLEGLGEIISMAKFAHPDE